MNAARYYFANRYIIVTISTLSISQGFLYDTEPLIDHKLFAELELILFYPNLFVTRK